MADVSDITSAMVTVLETLDWVDAASDTTFQPAVTVASCCALVVPFGMESTSTPVDLAGDYHRVVYRIPVEFWCKHTPGNQAAVMTTARDAGTLAMAALLAGSGSGYSIAPDAGFDERLSDGFVEHGNVQWLVSTLYVPVENEVAI